MNNKQPAILVFISEKMHEELWKIRRETGVSMSFFTRKAIEKELKRQRLQELRRNHG